MAKNPEHRRVAYAATNHTSYRQLTAVMIALEAAMSTVERMSMVIRSLRCAVWSTDSGDVPQRRTFDGHVVPMARASLPRR